MKINLHQYRYRFLFIIVFCFLVAFIPEQKKEESLTPPIKIKLTTNYGEMVIQLYDETPLHRDNFVKLVQEAVLDSLLFHRVIENFMIQTGDINSKNAQPEDTLGYGGLPYSIPAEITNVLFHKKGVLGAARGDTPERESSSTQFYIVQGKVLNDSLLDHAETRINGWLAEYYIKHDPAYNAQLDSLNLAMADENWDSYIRINDRFRKLAKEYKEFDLYHIPEAHREVYRTLGGTPHLDQNYTVFGEVISGLNVIDSIAAVKTNDLDRPLKDIRILVAQIVEN